MGVLTVGRGGNGCQETQVHAPGRRAAGRGSSDVYLNLPTPVCPGLCWGPACRATQNSLTWPRNPSFSSSKADTGVRGVEGGIGESSGLGIQQTPVLALRLHSQEP